MGGNYQILTAEIDRGKHPLNMLVYFSAHDGVLLRDRPISLHSQLLGARPSVFPRPFGLTTPYLGLYSRDKLLNGKKSVEQ